MWEKLYSIGDHDVEIKGVNQGGEDAFPRGFAPFERREKGSGSLLFSLETGVPLVSKNDSAHYNFLFEELNLDCEFVFGKDDVEFRMFPDTKHAGPKTVNSAGFESLQEYPIILKMPHGSIHYSTNLVPTDRTITEFSFLLWNAYGVASASYYTIAVHSSVIIYKERAVLFIGESGTGKSTHTQLWLRTINGSKLLNDDSPIVHVLNHTPYCYGSPWSGKGRRFRDESYPIAAIVRLRQSPSNHIERLNKIEAFSALYPSCPPSFTANRDLTDHVCSTLSEVIKEVPVYLLDCRPDAEAALLSCRTIFGDHDIIPSGGHE